MLKKLVIAAVAISSMTVGVPSMSAAASSSTASASNPCHLNCRWVIIRDHWGNPIGGYWECPGEEQACVE